MSRLRLRPDVHINVTYDDRTPTGSPVGDRPEALVQELFGSLVARAETDGYQATVERGPELLSSVVSSEAFSSFASLDPAGLVGGWTVSDTLLHPDPALARPRWLTIACPDTDRMARASVPAALWPEVHALIASLDDQGMRIADIRDANLRAFTEGLAEEGLVLPHDDVPAGPLVTRQGDSITFVGHNGVVFRSMTTDVLVDPLLVARKHAFPDSYQPLGARELRPIDAIVLTHTHRDHVDPATLLRFPCETRVIIPAIERETVLATDLALRLRELGFTDVVALEWGSSTTVGDIEVHALPFYGEQPTDTEVLHPEIRNAGNTYLLRSPNCSAVVLADAGRDGSGSMFDVATDVRRRFGRVDVAFIGYRGWLTYPVQLLFSSVGRYLWFVPPWLWDARLRLMLGPDEAVDLAERFGARQLVPYADGGAPWYWDLGLGPVLDGSGTETLGFDLFPERVVEAAARRVEVVDGSIAASPVHVLLLRPGESVRASDLRADGPSEPEILRAPGHIWPWPGETSRLPASQTIV